MLHAFNQPRQPGCHRTAPHRSNPVKALGVAAMVVTVVLWASAFVGIRAIGPHFSPAP
nr:hypothetical protein GCM10017547_09450 [Pseudarthrobacter oxydans]